MFLKKITLNCSAEHGVTVRGFFFQKASQRQSSGGCGFNPKWRQVTTEESSTLVPNLVNGIRTSDPRGLNKGCVSKCRVGFRNRLETSEEGRRIYWPKCWQYNNKYEENSPKTLNDKNYQPTSQKFKQLRLIYDVNFFY